MTYDIHAALAAIRAKRPKCIPCKGSGWKMTYTMSGAFCAGVQTCDACNGSGLFLQWRNSR